MFDFLKRKKKEAEETMATTDEKEVKKAEEDIAEKGEDSQTEKDRIDESVAAQEKETGNEDSQTAKDRVDESEGAEKADEKKVEEKTEEKGDDKLDRLITAIDKLVAALTPKENREPDSFDQKYGFKTKEPPMAGAKEYGEKEINALLGK